MHGIYNYIPKTNHVSTVHAVAAVPCLQCVATCNVISHVKNVVYFYISTSRSLCAVPNMAVFCSSLFLALPVCSTGIIWVILRWFQSPLLLMVSLLFSHFTCAEFLLLGLPIVIILLLLSLLLSLLSPLWKIFTIFYLKQTMSIGYV